MGFQTVSDYTSLFAGLPATLDLTNPIHLDQVNQVLDHFRNQIPDLEYLGEIEDDLITDKDNVPLMVHLAIKLARSYKIIEEIDAPLHFTVVFAVYKEHNRIRSQEEHEHGENFLLKKVEQLNRLTEINPHVTWDMIVVDDGCPEGSGNIAKEILAENDLEDNVRVLFLEDALKQGLAVTKPMESTRESQKGGSIEFGMWTAAQDSHERHIILFTDADLSTHLGQVGLLVDGIINQGHDAAIGSRRETNSVVVKAGKRNNRGKLFIYLWKRIIPQLNYIVDTQCGFKAFKAELIGEIVESMIEKKFAFDIELLLKTELRREQSIDKIPVAWIDSEAASTTTDIQPYLSMLKKMVEMYRTYLPQREESEPFAALIESLTEEMWNELVDHVPEAIASRNPAEFGEWAGVSVADLQSGIGENGIEG